MQHIKGANFSLKKILGPDHATAHLRKSGPLLMGILNVTPDSFSDGGKYLKPDAAARQVQQMVEAGADIIDIGGESTRPYAKSVSVDGELKRVIPVIRKARKKLKTLISIDTYKSEVARAALEEGADIINDISALRMDRRMGEVAARYDAPLVLMHMQGCPGNMQKHPRYRNVISNIIAFLRERIRRAKGYGIREDRIIVDPGIGFGKTVEHNLQIIKHLDKFKKLGRPLLIGPSRKSFIGKVLNVKVGERIEGTAAAIAICVWNGADIVRVHDVKQMRRVVEMARAIQTVESS